MPESLIKIHPEESEPGTRIVEFRRNFDLSTAPEIRRLLLRFVRQKRVKSVDFDFSHIKHMDTSGAAVLVEVYGILRSRRGKMRLIGLSRSALTLIGLAGLEASGIEIVE